MIPLDFLQHIATEYRVSPLEWKVLSKAIAGETTSAIALDLDITEDLVRKRLSDIYKKFRIEGRGPVKLARLQQRLHSLYQSSLAPENSSRNEIPISATGQFHLTEAGIDISTFQGRIEELSALQQWILQNNCHLIAILGIGGIGKTALAAKLVELIKDRFDCVIWRSLLSDPLLETAIADILQHLLPSTDNLPERLSEKISLLLNEMRSRRCLLIIDNVETILQRGELAGQYSPEYEGYQELFRRICEESHQSCLLISSQEKPENLGFITRDTYPARALYLNGLKVKDGREIFKSQNLSDEPQWNDIIEIYQGNPLALKIVATTIQYLFNGQAAEFIKRRTLLPKDIRNLLSNQFERLSSLEQELMYWLAIKSSPLDLEQLYHLQWLPISFSELADAIESLGQRFLIEKNIESGQVVFSLQPVVKEFLVETFIEGASQEIVEAIKTDNLEELRLLRSHAVTSTVKNSPNLILSAIKDKLLRFFKSPNRLRDCLNKILSELNTELSSDSGGYAFDNIAALVAKLEI
ncbi:hypothetical protein BCD67_05750 [Oscillatoriales cyanobacterium USR001]|nr:hypothetical protein BCD67_05750 [Oscillatoriales cyanobacterium USR001]